MNFLKAIGESVNRFAADAIRSMDGSWIAVQTDKPSYYAGETITGFVIAQINAPRQVDKILLKIAIKEKVFWDEEIARSHDEGEGENRRTITVYEHHERFAKDSWLKEIIVVSQLPHMLMPGTYRYPFSYTLRADLPGCVKFHKELEPADPVWRHAGRKLRVEGNVVYKLTGFFDVAGLFSKDLKCKQEVVVNAAFDWSKMAPAHGEARGEVRLLCCIPRGQVSLVADFDKAAYASGETAQIKAQIVNDSKEDVKHMVVKLMRFIELTDQRGQKKSIVDTVCQASYGGVGKLSKAIRDLPLPLKTDSGVLLPGTRSRRVHIHYRFDVECDLFCAPDIEVHLAPIIYQPAPAVWGLAAMGITMPVTFAVASPQPVVAVQPVMQVPVMPQVQVQMPVMPQVQVQMQPQPQMAVQVVANPAADLAAAATGMAMGMAMAGAAMNVQMQHQGSFHGQAAMQHQGSFHGQMQQPVMNPMQGAMQPQVGMNVSVGMGMDQQQQQQPMGMGMNVSVGMGMDQQSPMGMGMGGFGGPGMAGGNMQMSVTQSSSSTHTVNGQVVSHEAQFQHNAMGMGM